MSVFFRMTLLYTMLDCGIMRCIFCFYYTTPSPPTFLGLFTPSNPTTGGSTTHHQTNRHFILSLAQQHPPTPYSTMLSSLSRERERRTHYSRHPTPPSRALKSTQEHSSALLEEHTNPKSRQGRKEERKQGSKEERFFHSSHKGNHIPRYIINSEIT